MSVGIETFRLASSLTFRKVRLMKKQHGGWATQAKRRQEEYLGCTSCGMTAHPRMQAYPEPVKESFWHLLGLVIFVLFMYAVIIYALPIVLEAVVR